MSLSLFSLQSSCNLFTLSRKGDSFHWPISIYYQNGLPFSGIFAELVAKWIASQGVKPSVLSIENPVQTETDDFMETNEAESGKLPESPSKPPLKGKISHF